MNTHELAEYLLDFEPMEVRIGDENNSKPIAGYPTVIAVTDDLGTEHVECWEDIPEDMRERYKPAMEFYID